MTILWQSMDSWLPLLQLIPALRREFNVYNMHGLVQEQDFQRLDLYGRRIRRLDLQPMNRVVSPYIYTYIQLRHSSLFPALRELIIPDIARIGFENQPGLFLTLAPSLSELSLGGITPSVESVIGSLLQSVCIKAKGLRKLALTGRFTIMSLNIVNQFSKLETLEIYGRSVELPQDTLKKFSELVYLKSLTISLGGSSTFGPLSTNISSFEALHNLEISAPAVRVLIFLRHITVRHLRTIRIHFTSLGPDASQGSPGKCVETISRMTTASKSLKKITVTSDAAFVRVPAAELMHLKARTKVAHIDMVVDVVLAEAVHSLLSAGSWNSIQTLILRSGLAPGQGGEISTISIMGWLLSLPSFPNVKHLTISVIVSLDQLDVDAWRSAVQDPPVCHNLQDLVFLPLESCAELNCPDQTVENAFIFAQGIHNFCPHLRTFDLSRITYVNPDWRKGVEHMVIGLQKATNHVHVC
ncbi:hypothetical protein GALMADRAFT_139218 [Galerina marginata CBS 339.88]|uniref:F-box domain-containing protein n=1 Tax=Galerina marginata (strain CBS 339.88) TaxID=685588 RepID=A0A067T238_GALM3|nr:hypothetical protein GALMADRAFT_139218 [Galerina marginata CBS 339.88]